MKKPSRITRPPARPPSGRQPSLSPQNMRPNARLCAAEAVRDVLYKQAQLEIALNQSTHYNRLSISDRAFARLLAATTCRRLGQIRIALKPFVKRQPGSLAEAFLFIGVTQLLFLGTPPHAAVHETVNAARNWRETTGYAGMINAVLRRVSEGGKDLLSASAPQHNIPGWIKTVWSRAYGAQAMRNMATQYMQVPPLDLYAPNDAQVWAERLGGALIGDHTIRLKAAGQIELFPGYEDGAWWVQDLASTLPVNMLGDIAGQTVLDMCAAPGGKAMQLAASGAKVTALDTSLERLERLADNFARTNLEAEVFCTDARQWDVDTQYDIVLLDAPCTATGTFRRHPDVLHSKTPKTLSSLIKIQKSLLVEAAKRVKPGGTLVYCTCSLQPEEGEDQVSGFLADNPEWQIAAPGPMHVSELDTAVHEKGYVRVLPQFLGEMGGVDGFFTAKLSQQ